MLACRTIFRILPVARLPQHVAQYVPTPRVIKWSPQLQALIDSRPEAVHMRPSDGRGPLFWAYEYNQPEIAQFLIEKVCTARQITRCICVNNTPEVVG